MTTERYELLCLLLQTWRRPSFAPSCHWAVYGHYTDEPVPGAMVLGVSSRLPMDFEMPKTMAAPLFDLAANPGASGPLTARTAELPTLKLGSLLRAGRAIAIPVNVVIPGFGAPEGTTYGFRWEAGFGLATASFQWWEEGPKEWRAFTQWVVELQEFLGQCVGE